MHARISHEARTLLEQGKTIQETEKSLIHQGYARHDVKTAIQDFFRDEASKADEELIKEIEHRTKKGELLQDIMEDLSKKHTPFAIEKALLRAGTHHEYDLAASMKGWQAYTIIHLSIFLMTIVFGVFYKKAFFIATFFILILLIVSTMNIPRKTRHWKTEITLLPFTGMTITQGFWGYNSLIGNYVRWWRLDPALLLTVFFIMFTIYFSFLYQEWNMVVSGGSLAILSFASYYHPKKQYIPEDLP
jgi:hypothetical protein